MHPSVAKARFDDSIGRWPPDFHEVSGWVIHSHAFPILDCEFVSEERTNLRIRMDFTDWDDQPPSIELLNSNGERFKTITGDPTSIFNSGPHEKTGFPFVCMAGSREFHSHAGHLNEPWEQFKRKPGFDIGDILIKLWKAWRKGNINA